MEFDETKKIEVAVSENEFVENRVEEKKKFSFRDKGIDVMDMIIVPVAIGVFVSLGFLFATLFRTTAAMPDVTSIIGSML